ncbi:MAG TPA: hypothetical protein VIC33_10835 [Vicinamibacterales bacterium]
MFQVQVRRREMRRHRLRVLRVPVVLFGGTLERRHFLRIVLDGRLGDENIGAFCQLCDGVAWAGVSGKHDDPVRRFDPNGVGLHLLPRLRRHQRVMRILRGSHANPVVLEDESLLRNLMDMEGVGRLRRRELFGGKHTVRDADVPKSGINEFRGMWRPVDVENSRSSGHQPDTRVLVVIGHHIGQTEFVVGMQMGEKDHLDRL